MTEVRRISEVPVILTLPEPVSLDGLLGAVVVYEGSLHRLRTHEWGEHEITVEFGVAKPSRIEGAITVEISLFDGDMKHGEISASLRGRGVRGVERDLFEACQRLTRFAPPQVRPRQSTMLGISVRRLAGMNAEFAYRRGVHYLLTVLAELAGKPKTTIAQIPGIGRFDVGEVQRRLQRYSLSAEVSTIDPEVDLIETRLMEQSIEYIPSDPDPRPALESVADAFDSHVTYVYPEKQLADRLVGQFGVASERQGRRLSMSRRLGRTYAEVRSTTTRPVRGYVTFYAPSRVDDVTSTRVRAIDGVARCEVPGLERSYAIGAIVEDEGLPLEAQVERADAWVRSVCQVRVRGKVLATGFLVAGGHVLTVFHIAERDLALSVVMDGESLSREASIVHRSREDDWMLLRLAEPNRETALRLGRLDDRHVQIYDDGPTATVRAYDSVQISTVLGDSTMFSGTLRYVRGKLVTGMITQITRDIPSPNITSGAPCRVGGRVVAMITEVHWDRLPVEFDAISMAVVVKDSGGLLAWDDDGL